MGGLKTLKKYITKGNIYPYEDLPVAFCSSYMLLKIICFSVKNMGANLKENNRIIQGC